MIDKNDALFLVRLPFGQKTVPYEDVPELIWRAISPGYDLEKASGDEDVDFVLSVGLQKVPLEAAVRSGEVEVLNKSTRLRMGSGRLEDAVLTVRALRGYVESIHGCLEVEDAPEPQAAPVVTVGASGGVEISNISLLATPAELLDAFQKWGMEPAWFDDLNSRKWLHDARRKKGQGQRGHVIPPLFCPYLVMDGLMHKVRKAKRLNPVTAWRTLEHKFPTVYAQFESYDPREGTGD